MDVVRQIETRCLEIEDELRRTGRAFADGAFDEDDYDRRRKKLIAERDSLVVPDGAKAIEMGMQLETISDFMDDATDEEKYKIMHILFNAVYYDFGQNYSMLYIMTLDKNDWWDLNRNQTLFRSFDWLHPSLGGLKQRGLFLGQQSKIISGQT